MLQVKQTQSEKLKRTYEVVVPKETVEARIDAKLQGLSKNARIKGFRQGKAPLSVVKQHYGESVRHEVVEQLVKETTKQALEREKIKPALQPHIHVHPLKEGGDLSYALEVEILPEAPAIDYGSISIEKLVVTFDDKDLEDSLGRIREQTKAWEPAAGATAAVGHSVDIDFVGSIDGKVFEGGTGSNMRVELGAGQMIPGFEDQLIGAKAGESRTLKVTFPKDYHSKDVAGKKAEFATKILQVLKRQSLATAEALAEHLGMEAEDLRKKLREHLTKDTENISRARLKQALFDVLEKRYEFDVPETMLEMEFKAIWQEVLRERDLGINDDFDDKSEKEVEAEYRRVAKRRVELGILLSSISEKENLKFSNQEVMDAVRARARQFNVSEQDAMQFFSSNPAALRELTGPLLEEKVVDFIVGKIHLKEKQVPLKQMVEEEQAAAKKHEEKMKALAAKGPQKKAKSHQGHDHEHAHEHDCGDPHCGHEHDEPQNMKNKSGGKKKTSSKK